MTSTTRKTEIIAELRESPDLREALYSLHVDDLVDLAEIYVKQLLASSARQGVRNVEAAQARTAKTRAAYLDAAKNKAKQIMREKFGPLLDQEIALPGGHASTWGDATADQLKERANMLDTQLAGLRRTSDLTHEAIAAIASLGGQTLREALS